MLLYKPDAAVVIERLRSLYERRAQDQIFASFEIPCSALGRFGARYAHGFCEYPDPDERLRFWDELLEERSALEDDSIPCAYLSEFDQGLYGGLVGGDVRFIAHPDNGWISSMVPPLLEDWGQFPALAFHRSNPWWQRYLRQLAIFREGAEGKFGISHFILIDSLNFVFELLGATKTYLSLFEHPEQVRQAIDFAFELNLAVQSAFFENVPAYRGGTFSNMAQWIPGRIVSESVDPFHMTSVQYFEKWGRAPVERILDQFDGGVLHLHGNGRHLLEAVCSLRKLKALQLGDDKGFPASIEALPELKARAGDLPLVVHVEYPVFQEKLARHQLSGGVFYKVQNAPDAGCANRLMEAVRAYRL